MNHRFLFEVSQCSDVIRSIGRHAGHYARSYDLKTRCQQPHTRSTDPKKDLCQQKYSTDIVFHCYFSFLVKCTSLGLKLALRKLTVGQPWSDGYGGGFVTEGLPSQADLAEEPMNYPNPKASKCRGHISLLTSQC